MDKKLNYLSIIPLYGTCIILIYLFIQSIKQKISKNRFMRTFWICALISAVCWVMVGLVLYIINNSFHILFLKNHWTILLVILAGYMMNIFTFRFINKKWEYLAL